jgi:hypothetical protein
MTRTLLRALLLIPLSTGCDPQDSERLARVGRVVTTKVQALAPQRTPFAESIGLNQNPEERVRSRIRSDRYLSALPIDVSADGGTVRLKGSVDQEVLKRRAVEIAESTVGVDKVIDELSVLP